VGAAENENTSAAQKELLKWHWKLGVGTYRIQEMMRERHYEDPDGRTTILPAIIQPKKKFYSWELYCPTLPVVSFSTRKEMLTECLTCSAA